MRRRTSDDTLEITTLGKHVSPAEIPFVERRSSDIDDLCNPLRIDDPKHLSASILSDCRSETIEIVHRRRNFNDEDVDFIARSLPRPAMIAFPKISGYNPNSSSIRFPSSDLERFAAVFHPVDRP